MKKYLLFLTTILLAEIVTDARISYENISFRQLDNSDGLPHNTVNAIVQDSNGFLWFGTRNGLCKYDGYTLRQYFHNEDDSTSLSHDFIFGLYTDPVNRRIWVSTEEGLCAYDCETDSFRRYAIPGNRKNDVEVTLTSEGMLLAGCSNGIFRYNPETDAFDAYLLHRKNFVKTIVDDGNGCLWIECGNTIVRFDTREGKTLPLPQELRRYRQDCTNFTWVGNDRLLFESSEGVMLFNTRTYAITNLSGKMDSGSFRCAATDVSDNIWIGTESGIFVLDGQTYGALAHYEQKSYDTSRLNDTPIYSIFRDRNDNMWVGTYFGGINYYIYGSEAFRIYPYGDTPGHLSGKAVRQIIGTPDGGILLATEDGGLNYIGSDGKIIRSRVIHNRLNVNARNIHSLKFARDGSLLIGLFLKGLLRYDPETGITENYGELAPKGSSGFCITEDRNGLIWYGGPSGLFCVRKDEPDPARKVERISGLPVFCFLEENDSSIIIGTRNNGICTLDTEKLDIDTLDVLPNPNLFVTYLYRSSGGDLYVGTNNNGLIVLDSTWRTERIYTKKDIFSNGIKGIIEDSAHNIWVGTDNGLVCIDVTTQEIHRFTVADGLPTNQLNYSSAYMDDSGEVFFGTFNGLVSFFPVQIRSMNRKFNVQITDVLYNGTEDTPVSSPARKSYYRDKLTLTHSQAKSIRIEYSGMNYKYTYNTQYAMFMEGIDKDWQYVGNQHQVRFSNLSSGDYVLKIKASHDGLTWDDDGMKTLKIKVLPPWWLSWWAYLVYSVLALLAVLFTYRYAKARLILRMKLKTEHERRLNTEKLNRQKTDFFTYVSHDLKTPLTLILSPLKKIISSGTLSSTDQIRLETVYRNAARMNYLIDELLTFSKIEMNQMHISVRQGDIVNFIREISQIFDEVSKEREVQFIRNFEGDGTLVWFSPSKLERILYNLLSNAFKYTHPGDYVKLSVRLDTGSGKTIAVISVKDSGRGIPKELQEKIFESYFQVEKQDHRNGFGLGLALTRSLVHIHKGEITVCSEPGKGSEFTVTLDVSANAYTPEERLSEGITPIEIRKYNQRMKDTLELIPDKKPEEDRKESERETIMLVEDNRDMNDYLCELFGEKYDIIKAYNGEEALKVLQKRLPDVIVSDIMMPRMDGLELTRRVKNDVATSHIPVILLTAKTDEADFTEGYRSGAEAYITKPFSAENLELLIRNIQKNRKMSIERFRKAEKLNVKQIVNNPRDEKFMKELVALIMKNISNEEFSVGDITSGLHISRSLLHTKLKSLTGCSITQFLRTIRMKEAKKRLMEGLNVSEASYAVGMSDPNYFTKCFRKEFNITPTDFIRQMTSRQ